jgi:hypothetical protein
MANVWRVTNRQSRDGKTVYKHTNVLKYQVIEICFTHASTDIRQQIDSLIERAKAVLEETSGKCYPLYVKGLILEAVRVMSHSEEFNMLTLRKIETLLYSIEMIYNVKGDNFTYDEIGDMVSFIRELGDSDMHIINRIGLAFVDIMYM